MLLLAFHFPPDRRVSSLRALRFARYLPDEGWDPVVVAGASSDPAAPAEREESFLPPNGVPVVRAPLRSPLPCIAAPFRALRQWRSPTRTPERHRPPATEAPGGPLRWARDLLFFTPDAYAWWLPSALLATRQAVRRFRPEVLLATAPPATTLAVGLAASRWCRLPLVVDIRDPLIRTPWAARSLTSVRRGVLTALERSAMRRAAAVIVTTTTLADELAAEYPDQERSRLQVIPNGFDPLDRELIESLPNKPVGGDEILLLHPGTLYVERDLRPVIEAIARLDAAGVRIGLRQLGRRWGDDPMPLARQLGVADRVEVFDAVSRSKAFLHMAAADLFLLLQPRTALQVPAKLFEMLLFDRPVVAVTDRGETAELVRRYELGTLAASSHPGEIAEAILAAVERRQELPSRRGRAAALIDFDGRRLSAQLARRLSEVADRGPRE